MAEYHEIIRTWPTTLVLHTSWISISDGWYCMVEHRQVLIYSQLSINHLHSTSAVHCQSAKSRHRPILFATKNHWLYNWPLLATKLTINIHWHPLTTRYYPLLPPTKIIIDDWSVERPKSVSFSQIISWGLSLLLKRQTFTTRRLQALRSASPLALKYLERWFEDRIAAQVNCTQIISNHIDRTIRPFVSTVTGDTIDTIIYK